MKKVYLLEEIEFNIRELEDLKDRVEWSFNHKNEFDDDDAEILEAEIEDVLDLLKGHFEELLKLIK